MRRRATANVAPSLPLLGDPSRIVRMQAARTLAPLAATGSWTRRSVWRTSAAADEYVAAERFNADRPEHRTNLGGFYAESRRARPLPRPSTALR